MSEVLRLHGLGAVVEVRCTGSAAAELAAAMRTAWSRCRVAPAISPVRAEPLEVQLEDVAMLPYRLMTTTQAVTRALIFARAGGLLMFHAGAVSDPRTGRSVVFVAKGGTGKTTLSALLGQRLGYLTDETVGIDESGVICPYPKPLSIRRTSDVSIKDEVSPDDLGLLATPERAHVGRVVFLDRQPLVDGVELEELLILDAVVGLAEQSSSLPRLTRPLHRIAGLIDRTGPVIRVRYSEAAEAQEVLKDLCRGPL
ncbi:hypothetical protein V6K52_07980 [Knoellia sp. S7-12]|uniref:hypothetical protein n=1 Tax=Knoellia sp. S7-12 TaxID=3126698 RepID=UPI003367A602